MTRSKPNMWHKLNFLKTDTTASHDHVIPPETYVVGLSMIDLEPAIMTPPRSNQRNISSTEYLRDSLDGPPIRGAVSGRLLGHSIIPFHEMTVFGNLTAFKNATRQMLAGRRPVDASIPSLVDPEARVGNAKPVVLSHAVRDAFAQGKTQFGAAMISQTEAFVTALSSGNKLKPVVKSTAGTAWQAIRAKNSGAQLNAPTPTINLLNRGLTNEPSGFRLHLAPIVVMDFNDEMLKQLREFLKAH